MNPCADLSVPIGSDDLPPPPLPSRTRNDEAYTQDEDDYEISVYADDDVVDDELEYNNSRQQSPERQWRYEEEPYYDDIFHDDEYIEDHFNSDDDEDCEHTSSNYYFDNDSLYSEGNDNHYQQ
jgi:hypothetical protein